MSSGTAMRRTPPPLPSRSRRCGVRPPPLPPPLAAGVTPPPLPDVEEVASRFIGVIRAAVAMAVTLLLVAGLTAWNRLPSDLSRSGEITLPLASISHVAAVQIDLAAGSSISDDVADEAAPEVEDPLAALAYVIAGDIQTPLREGLDDLEVAAAPSITAPPPQVSSHREESSSGKPGSYPGAALTHSLPTLPTLAPAACAGVCRPPESRKLGTALEWARSVKEGAQQSKDAGKLLFVIHVSGNFESPGFT